MAFPELALTLTLVSSGMVVVSVLSYIYNIYRSNKKREASVEVQQRISKVQQRISKYDIEPEDIKEGENIENQLDLEHLPPEEQELVENLVKLHLMYSVINAESDEDQNRSYRKFLRQMREQNATELNISSEDLDQLSLEEISERKQSET